MVAKDLGNKVQTRGAPVHAGAKAFPVKEEARQLKLIVEVAEESAQADADGEKVSSQELAFARAARRPRIKQQKSVPATIGEVTNRLLDAFEQVAKNRGAPGPDRITIEEVRKHLTEIVRIVSRALLEGSYTPGDIRRVWIPKSGGGQRGLGIPNVVDRMVQEAVRRVIEPLYEPTFHGSSHGFRPGRSCHTAIAEAKQYVDDGNEWVVDLDLEKFFDKFIISG